MFTLGDSVIKSFTKAMSAKPFDTNLRRVMADRLEELGCLRAARKHRMWADSIDVGENRYVLAGDIWLPYVARFMIGKVNYFICKDGDVLQKNARSKTRGDKRKSRQKERRRRNRRRNRAIQFAENH